jgi:CTP:molybdopterin cytidylyltransferase MocA
MIAGVILAAGKSSRMGRDKARLSIEGEPAIERLVRIFAEAGLDPIVVVGGDRIAGATVVPGEPDGEMIDSLARGIEALPLKVQAAVVQPVDAPFTSADAIRALVAKPNRARVLSFGGTPGHPVLVPQALFAEIRKRPDGGLRSLLAQAEQVPWDRTALADLDTPEDLVRWKVEDA